MNLVGLDRPHDVFKHADTLVVVKLGTEVGVTRGVRDFGQQLGNPGDEAAVGLRPAAVFRRNAQQNIGLGLAVGTGIPRGFGKTSRSSHFIVRVMVM